MLLVMLLLQPLSTLFPYTTLFRSFRLGTVVDMRKGGTVSNLTLNLYDEGNTTWDYDKPSPNPTVGATLGAYRYNTWAGDRKSTRLNSSHRCISYAVFCLKKKTN